MRKIAPGTIIAEDNCPPEKCPFTIKSLSKINAATKANPAPPPQRVLRVN